MVEPDQLAGGIGPGVYGAITQFQALASVSPSCSRAKGERCM
jgi:hypothetical protein